MTKINHCKVEICSDQIEILTRNVPAMLIWNPDFDLSFSLSNTMFPTFSKLMIGSISFGANRDMANPQNNVWKIFSADREIPIINGILLFIHQFHSTS